MLGFTEILVMLLIVLVIFGGRRIPELGRSLGGGIKSFKRAIQDDDPAREPEESERDRAPRAGSAAPRAPHDGSARPQPRCGPPTGGEGAKR